MTRNRPVFYDTTQRRGPIVKKIVLIIIAIVLFLAINFCISLIIKPLLPAPGALSMQNSSRHYTSSKHIKSKKEQAFKMAGIETGFAKQELEAHNLINLFAYYVEWDDTSWTSLRENLNKIDVLVPERLQLQTDGMHTLYPEKAKRTLEYVEGNHPSTKILPLINNFDTAKNQRNGEIVKTWIQDGEKRQQLVSSILTYIDNNKLDGINIDFENLDEQTWHLMIPFLQELQQELKDRDGLLTINLPFGIDSAPYKEISPYVSKIFVMAYDEHWASAKAGSIAGIGWYASGLQELQALNTGNISIAIGNYGYDWTENKKDSVAVTWQEALTTMNESSGTLVYDQATLNPTYDYYDEKDALHHVWFLDATTAYNQITIARNQGIDSFALWRLGSEDPSFWTLIDNKELDEETSPLTLENIGYGYDIQYEGSGVLLQLKSNPSTGYRDITYNSGLELITNENIVSLPTPYIINRYNSAQNKKLLLTFDDGPSEYTPQILDILKQYNIPAVFFMIGNNVELYPDIAQRVYNEGHIIGNHSFSHPDISEISNNRMLLELDATQRIIEATTNHSTILFRPPYSVDIEPRDPSEARILSTLKQLGYYIMGLNIDPNDWENPGAETIVNRTLSEASGGSVILLHDGGGDRSQTIQALPEIITKLKQEGYTFVSAADILGVPAAQLMPSLNTKEAIFSLPNRIMVHRSNIFIWLISYLFLFGIIIGGSRLLIIIVLALWQAYKKRSKEASYKPNISVLVPAYNEGVVILKTIENLLESAYDNFECIVIDDGSKDNTYELVQKAYGNHRKVRLVTQENGGKAAALNHGIKLAHGEIIVIQDADTLFDKHALSKLANHFSDPRVGAVAGNVKVGNLYSWIARCQAIEYITSQNLDRRAFDVLNCITVVPGAIGAWRKAAVEEVGGLSYDTLAEDADLTAKVLRAGYRIVHEEGAIAMTETPETILAFTKQRFRWMFGTLQMMWKHADALFSIKTPGLGFFALPNLFIFQIFFPLLAPILDIIGFLNIIVLAFNLFGHYSQTVSAHSWHLLLFYLVFIVVDAITTIISFSLEKTKKWSLVWRFPIQRLTYRLLMYRVGLKVIYTALAGKGAGRNKLQRKGNVEMK